MLSRLIQTTCSNFSKCNNSKISKTLEVRSLISFFHSVSIRQQFPREPALYVLKFPTTVAAILGKWKLRRIQQRKSFKVVLGPEQQQQQHARLLLLRRGSQHGNLPIKHVSAIAAAMERSKQQQQQWRAGEFQRKQI
jgi:hypothetical protein